MKLTLPFHFLLSLVILSILISCGPDEMPEEVCQYSPTTSCSGYSFSIVDKDTYESLIGTDGQLIHPDSIYITNTRKDTMSHEARRSSDGRWAVERFNPFQEISCFNQCLLDSAFTRTYYLYIGNGTTDTMEFFFPVRSPGPNAFLNGVSGRIQPDFPKDQSIRTAFYFRK
jgi:hypothetical protein